MELLHGAVDDVKDEAFPSRVVSRARDCRRVVLPAQQEFPSLVVHQRI